MIVDTSALVAIFFDEPEASHYTRLIQRADYCLISVANFVEVHMVIQKQVGNNAGVQCEAFFRGAGILIEPVTIDHGLLARLAFLDFGKGRHPAGLNFGDCFAYALAKATGQPLLFKGEDFSKTDIKAASEQTDPDAYGYEVSPLSSNRNSNL